MQKVIGGNFHKQKKNINTIIKNKVYKEIKERVTVWFLELI